MVVESEYVEEEEEAEAYNLEDSTVEEVPVKANVAAYVSYDHKAELREQRTALELS